MSKHTQPPAPVVSVINMKGGVGKTLIAANVFGAFFRIKKKRLLLVDFDPQFNLSQLLLKQVEYDQIRTNKKTLYYVLHPPRATSVFQVTDEDFSDIGDVDQFTTEIEAAAGSPDIGLRLLAGDFDLAKLNLRERDSTLRVPRERFRDFVHKAQQCYDLIILDCNPSTSFLTRTALESSTHIVVPIRPDRYSILGAKMLHQFMHSLPTLAQPPKELLLLNGIPNDLKEPESSIIRELRADPEFGPLTMVSTVPLSNVLKARSDYAGFAMDRGVPYVNEINDRLEKVATELSKGLGV